MRFDGFAGNEPIKRQLAAAMDGGKLPHALLIEGPVGSGRRTLARLIAKAAVCESDGDRPCGRCAACVKAESGHPDMLTLTGSGAPRALGVGLIRELREQCFVLPNEARRRTVIIENAQSLSTEAQNALLKILEEPPSYALFVLVCESAAQLLATIRSRCVTLTLYGVTEEEALPVLRERLPEVPQEELRQAVRLFDGCIGQVIGSFGGGELEKTLALTADMGRALVAPGEWELLQITGKLEGDMPLADAVLQGLRLLLRDALCKKCGGTAMLSADIPTAELLAASLTAQQLTTLITETERLQTARRRNINQTLFLTLLCSRLRAAAGK